MQADILRAEKAPPDLRRRDQPVNPQLAKLSGETEPKGTKKAHPLGHR